MHKKFEDQMYTSEDMIVDKHTHYNTPLPFRGRSSQLRKVISTQLRSYQSYVALLTEQMQLSTNHRFTPITQVNLRWRILLVQSVTAHMPLLTTISAFRAGRRY